VPVETAAPPLGERVAFTITDQGRAALAERFGPGLLRVEGEVAQVDSDQVSLNVLKVRQIGSNDARWAGELVRIDRSFIGFSEQRKLSHVRTFLLVGAATGAIVVIASQDLIGFGNEENPTPPDDEPSSSRAWWGAWWGK
jgi:hypothetical protein